VAAPGFRAWNRKGDVLHVEPPFELLERMVTLRVHLDPVSKDNAPLLIAPGSHRLGRVPEAEVPSAVERCGTSACLAEGGDVWAYATPIIHASEAARQPARRPVLQVDYSAEELPFGLRWQGIQQSEATWNGHPATWVSLTAAAARSGVWLCSMRY